jgi:hypothetical protein
VSRLEISGLRRRPPSLARPGILILAYQATGLHQSKNALSANERDFCNFGRGGGQFSPQA